MRKRVKVLLIGPLKSGKTAIANLLAEYQDTLIQTYRPTVGCRVLEFEKELKEGSGRVLVELWDVSGDPKYEKCWPAIQQKTNGIVFVYDSSTAADTDMSYWIEGFSKKMKLAPQFCIAFANRINPESKTKIPPMKGVVNVEFSQETPQAIQVAFDKYIQGLMTNTKLPEDGTS
eukprot:TRINITY_DN2809_c0_g1_i1.p1 TRINITY_DN2809_c0_g1~~TRINITY_DN2809_c0_g1_i1.p1  ORF type:complete len:193 (+),score=54.19 TRINITY_DN2809_c0_g1_i1:59-580(+)